MAFPQTVPRLTADGITLRAHQPSDAGAVLEQCRDPLSRQWTTVPLDYTYRDAQEFVTVAMPAGWDDDSEWSFAVEAPDDGTPRFAGTVSLRNQGHGRAEIAFGSHPWVRGRGHMETALRLLLDWGFGERGLRTDPARRHRARRPEHDHALRGFQRIFDDLVERFARTQSGVPPDGQALVREPVRKAARRLAIRAAVREKDIHFGQPTSPLRDRTCRRAKSL